LQANLSTGLLEGCDEGVSLVEVLPLVD
jgi:hypothetical protein